MPSTQPGRESARRSNLVLFPLCDSRGAVTSVICGRPAAKSLELCRPDAIFFAWLLDLPVNVSPAQAAQSLLAVAGPGLDTANGEQNARTLLRQMLVEIALNARDPSWATG